MSFLYIGRISKNFQTPEILDTHGFEVSNFDGIEISHWGNYFVFTFLKCFSDFETNVDNIIVVTTRNVSSTISIICMETNETWEVSLEPFEEYKLHLNSSVTAIPFGEILPRKAIVVMASTKVSVYGFSANGSSVDGFLVIPVAGLGNEYRTVSPVTYRATHSYPEGGPQFAVVAVEDETNLTITFTINNRCIINKQHRWNIGQLKTFTLSTYDVLNIWCASDTTGSLVQSSKPVAVLSGSIAVAIPISAYPNHVVEMLPPTKDYGYQWVVQAPTGTDYSSMYRIIFHENNTTISFYDPPEIFYPGDFIDVEIENDDKQQFCFSTNKPVLVVLINRGTNEPSSTYQYQGEAYMSIIPPYEKYGNYYVVPYGLITNATDRLAIIGYTEYRHLLVPQVTPYESVEHCDDVFETSIVSLPYSSQVKSSVYHCAQPFAVLMYGYNVKLGYGLPGGFNVTDTSGEEECLSSPCLDNGWCIETSLSFFCYYAEMTTTTANYNSSYVTEYSTTESTISDTPSSTTEDTSTTNDVTTNNTTEEASNTTGTESNLTTTQIPKLTKYPTTTNSTTVSISEFRRIYFLCECPCVNRLDTTKNLLIHEEEQKKNILSKANLSKTQREKTSADNITKAEQDLGFTAVFIMTSICSIIVLLDLLKLAGWIRGYICRRKQTLEESQQRSW
ncbi:hypothetical protein LOTGIDRAFT_159932 [Lottia gigantea]|uniref:IgGFc-binding protein N-terminal domain-containing protein n=1 Tax=Lottia gigantea TaxID=225164 RepID=V4AS26_LOTGI|nr:hypothetical protein LOTGIDRAFT_159932 [Lottia gigantea]ESO96516.1 hypothetical protein LOTGIDRAFT_159932 [Lottia gigantea]